MSQFIWVKAGDIMNTLTSWQPESKGEKLRRGGRKAWGGNGRKWDKSVWVSMPPVKTHPSS